MAPSRVARTNGIIYRVIQGHLGWVRSVAFHPNMGCSEWSSEAYWRQIIGQALLVSNKHTYMFSAGDDKQVKCWDFEQRKVFYLIISLPKGEFCHNMLSQQRATINAVAVNEDGVMVTGDDNGSLWLSGKSGHSFQQAETIVQPGSLESETCIYAACHESHDRTSSRLGTCEADKTIKMWKEDENATPETHPLNFRPPKEIRRL